MIRKKEKRKRLGGQASVSHTYLHWTCPKCGPIRDALLGVFHYHCSNVDCDEVANILSPEERAEIHKKKPIGSAYRKFKKAIK